MTRNKKEIRKLIMIAGIILMILIIWLVCLIFGIKLCNKNNAFGVVLLFIALNIIGLIIGIAMIYNSKNKKDKKTKIKEEKEELEKFILNIYKSLEKNGSLRMLAKISQITGNLVIEGLDKNNMLIEFETDTLYWEQKLKEDKKTKIKEEKEELEKILKE